MTTAFQLMTLFRISYGQIAAASKHRISKSSCYRIVNGLAVYTPKQKEAFTQGLAICIQDRALHLDSSFLFSSPATLEPAKTEPVAIEQEPLKLTA
jgi:hypothetical protein